MNYDRLFDEIRNRKEKLSQMYGVDASRIVYVGGGKYIVVTQNGEEVWTIGDEYLLIKTRKAVIA